MKKIALAVALSAAFVSQYAGAWGADGHRAVGAIADRLIKGTAAEKQVKALLLPGESLESISTWADCVKGSYCGPQTQEMIDYVAANPKHSEYHYTDVPFQLDHYHDGAAGTTDVDIVQTLKEAIAVLQGKDTPETNPHRFTKRQALILVTHLAGDIVQPMHVGAAFVDKDGHFVVPKTRAEIDDAIVYDTRGGNNFLLDDEKIERLAAGASDVIPKGEPKPVKEGVPHALTRPFHTYWDSTVVDYAFRRIGTKTPEKFAQAIVATQPSVAKNSGDPVTWPYQWADDTLVVAKQAFDGVHAGQLTKQTGKKGDTYYTWSLEVPQNYPVPSSAIAKTQLTKGGYQLAALLETIWPRQ